jgi:hypothetical protein
MKTVALRLCLVLMVSIALVPTAVAKDKKMTPPYGVLAASVGDEVVLVSPITGQVKPVQAGPVAWLFPAPGGILFAPDLVNGKTTVIDLQSLTARDTIPGVTMPRFGSAPDRYFVLADRLMVMSYPERALLNRFEIGFEHPWQVEVVADNTVLFVLERLPQGSDEGNLVAVNLGEGQLVYRRPLHGDVRRFALSAALRVMALAAAGTGQVVIADPVVVSPVDVYQVEGKPVDVVFAGDETMLVAAVDKADDSGQLRIWKLKLEKKKGLVVKKEWTVVLPASPVRMVRSPDWRHVAVALSNGEVQIIEVVSQLLASTAQLPGELRDIVWCDPMRAGPLLPEWSDDDEPTLNLGGGQK